MAEPPGNRTIVYTRVSTDRQEREATADSQEREALQFAAAKKLLVARVAHEQHTGAQLHERPVLSQVREAVRNKEVDTLLVHSVDRLSRDAAHLLILHDECQRAGVQMQFVTEEFDTSPEGKLMMSVKGFVAEVERLKIIERVTRGKRQRVERGKLHLATPLYGYVADRETTQRAIVEAEAAVIRRIYDLALAGFGSLVIARKLNAEGIPAPTADKRTWKDGRTPQWNKSAVQRICREPAYAGQSVAYRWHHEKRQGKPERILERPRSEWVILPDSLTPAIVTLEEFDRLQLIVQARKCGDAARNEQRPTLLRGMIFCVCGSKRSPSEGSYRCVARSSSIRNCKSGGTNRQKVEQWAWFEMVRQALEPGLLEAVFEDLPSDHSPETLEARKNELTAALARSDTATRKLLRQIEESDDETEAIIRARLREVAQQSRNAKAELETIERKMSVEKTEAIEITEKLNLLQIARERMQANGRFDEVEKIAFLRAMGARIIADGNQGWQIRFAANRTD